MKTGTWLLLGLGAFVVWSAVKTATAVNVIQAQFTGVNPIDFLHYQFEFVIQNVSNVDLTLNSMAGMLSVNGYSIGSVSAFNDVTKTIETIPANSSEPLAVNVDLSAFQLSAAMQALLGAGTGLVFRIKGNMNVSGLGLGDTVVPFDTGDYTYNG